jgi:hypothetical protein
MPRLQPTDHIYNTRFFRERLDEELMYERSEDDYTQENCPDEEEESRVHGTCAERDVILMSNLNAFDSSEEWYNALRAHESQCLRCGSDRKTVARDRDYKPAAVCCELPEVA